MGPIGIFDSGIGGLGIAQAIARMLPKESIIYLADSKNCPYGTKPVEQIQQICESNASYLINKHKAKMIVVACNTATVTSILSLRNLYPNIPFIGVVPVIKTAVERTKTKEIAVLSTPNTLKSQAYQDLLNEFAVGTHVDSISCPGLAELIELNVNDEEIKKQIVKFWQPYKDKNIDTVVLGCTHYTLIESIVREIIGPKITLLDSNQAVARHVKRVLEKENLLASDGRGNVVVKVNGNPKKILEKF